MKIKLVKGSICLLLSVTLLLSACSKTLTPGESGAATVVQGAAKAEYSDIFKKDSVADIYIEIPEEDWNDILANPTAEEYHSATVTVNGVKVKNVGFRTKGNLTLSTTARSDSDRYSFRIKFDEYVDNQELSGLDELVINNMLFDPSYMREYLSYEAIAQLGVDTPLAVFSNVYINNNLFGFYLCVEAIDDSYTERVFGDNNGNLYKADRGSTLLTAESLTTLGQKNGKDESQTDLTSLIKTLNAMPEGEKGDIESILDVDSALKYIAANEVLANDDSYLGNNAHNYYLYNDNGIFSMLPWDYNLSYGTGMSGGNFGIGGNTQFGGNAPELGNQPTKPAGADGVTGATAAGDLPKQTAPDSQNQQADSVASAAAGGNEQGDNGALPENLEQPPQGERPTGGRDGQNPGGMGGGPGGGMGGSTNLVTASITTPVFSVESAQRPLVAKLLAVPEYYERYIGYVTQLNGYFETLQNGRITEVSTIIRPYVQADPTNFYTDEQFETQVTASTDATALIGFVTQRLANVKEQLAAAVLQK